MDFITNWFTEILIAIVTAVSIFIFRNYLHPFVLGVLQKTPDLKGTWEGFDIDDKGNEQLKSRMELTQLGANIYASVYRKGSNNIERVFKYKGTISSGQVLLIWREQKSNGYNMGTMTLLLSGNLMTLVGKSTYNHHDKGEIVSEDRLYKKVNH